jgi:hypothetical protein
MVTDPVPVSPHDAEAPQITPIRAASKAVGKPYAVTAIARHEAPARPDRRGVTQ